MVVDALLDKHFNDLVYPNFTAEMEEKLDLIAHGDANKTEFLSNFYIGSNSSPGLLHRVTSKLRSNEMDHTECRSLVMPQISHLGTIQISRNGAYVSSKSNGGDTRWTLPDNMFRDIREINADAIAKLMSSETSINGEVLGLHPTLNVPVKLKSGRYGKYLQIGAEGEKKMITKSLPNITGDISMEDILPYLVGYI
jgi:DNA topoisomerase-1